jgi:hypothetical protein
MKTWTFLEIEEQIDKELALHGEDFVDSAEKKSYINQAIDEAEAEIHKLGAENEYFLSKKTIPMTIGQTEFSLPTDIYANKILSFVFDDGINKYEVKRIHGAHRFERLTWISPQEPYRYLILNTGPLSNKIVLYPASRETALAYLTIWYIRNANRIVEDTDICDIPEFMNFIVSYAKAKCLAKEYGGIMPPDAILDMQRNKKLMIETLQEMVPDEANQIELDLDFYTNHN